MNDDRAQAMFGTTVATAQKIEEAFAGRGKGDQFMELMSRLSDVQELIAMGRDENARTDINIVKMLLSNLHREARAQEAAG